MIATPQVVLDAYTNEMCLLEKARHLENGTMICLKDFVSQDDWKKIVDTHKIILQARDDIEEMPVNNASGMAKNRDMYMHILEIMLHHPSGLRVRDFKNIDSDISALLKHQHNAQIHIMYKSGLVSHQKDDRKWFITDAGKKRLQEYHLI